MDISCVTRGLVMAIVCIIASSSGIFSLMRVLG